MVRVTAQAPLRHALSAHALRAHALSAHALRVAPCCASLATCAANEYLGGVSTVVKSSTVTSLLSHVGRRYGQRPLGRAAAAQSGSATCETRPQAHATPPLPKRRGRAPAHGQGEWEPRHCVTAPPRHRVTADPRVSPCACVFLASLSSSQIC